MRGIVAQSVELVSLNAGLPLSGVRILTKACTAGIFKNTCTKANLWPPSEIKV